MELADYSRFFFALAFVVGLIWVLAAAVKRFGLDKKLRGITGAQGRLQLVDVLHLDPRRKLALVRADAREYLLVIGDQSVTVIDKLDVKNETH